MVVVVGGSKSRWDDGSRGGLDVMVEFSGWGDDGGNIWMGWWYSRIF